MPAFMNFVQQTTRVPQLRIISLLCPQMFSQGVLLEILLNSLAVRNFFCRSLLCLNRLSKCTLFVFLWFIYIRRVVKKSQYMNLQLIKSLARRVSYARPSYTVCTIFLVQALVLHAENRSLHGYISFNHDLQPKVMENIKEIQPHAFKMLKVEVLFCLNSHH